MNDRKLVMKALLPVTDFLNKCYPCGCDKGAASHPDDECPGEIHEAEEVIRTVLEAVAADIWNEGFDAGCDDILNHQDDPGVDCIQNPYEEAE